MLSQGGRRRPRDRKQQIISAVGRLCETSSYQDVTMEMVASAIGMTPGALYRHYSGKAELLFAAILAGLDEWESETRLSDSLPDTLAASAAASIKHRSLVGLILRESDNLAPDDFVQLQDRIQQFNNDYTSHIVRVRPGLDTPTAHFHGWILQAILSSPSFHNVSLPNGRYGHLLVSIATDSLHRDLGTQDTAGSAQTPVMASLPRRQRVMACALRAFEELGYGGAHMSEIGRRAGLSGPSIYLYFESKEELFTAVLDRFCHGAWLGLQSVLDDGGGPSQVLGSAVRSYVHVLRAMPGYPGTIVREFQSLPNKIRDAHEDLLDLWLQLIQACAPTLSTKEARILTETCLAVIHNLARKSFLRTRRTFYADLAVIGCGVVESGIEALVKCPSTSRRQLTG